jgi:hypothetical protein
MAEHLSLIVRAATASDAGRQWVTALGCQRRPGRRPCPGHLAVVRSDVPASIRWQCSACGDDGVISGWEGSPFDLRNPDPGHGRIDSVRVVIPDEVAAALRSLMLLDRPSERLVFRAEVDGKHIVLSGGDDDLDELVGYVAAEANHEENRQRQKRLDAAFEVLNGALRGSAR